MKLIIQLIEHLGNLLCMIFMVRIFLQLAQADFNNPISQFVHKFTRPVIEPLRSIVPDFGKFNTASLVFILLIIAAKFFILSQMLNAALTGKALLVGVLIGIPPFAGLVMNLVTLLTVLFIGLMITSFLAGGQYNPALMFFHQVTQPILRPLQKVIPPIGGTIDITPMIILFVLLYLQQFLVNFGGKLLS